jgi:hypothetical protein
MPPLLHLSFQLMQTHPFILCSMQDIRSRVINCQRGLEECLSVLDRLLALALAEVEGDFNCQICMSQVSVQVGPTATPYLWGRYFLSDNVVN